MKAYDQLPAGYAEAFSIDLKNDKKAMIAVNVLAIIIAVVMVVAMHFVVPITELFDMDSMGRYFARFGVMLAGIIVYMVLHEFTHGAAMKLTGGKQVKYGFAWPYAYAGSELDYFDKGAYRLIALAPVVVWLIIFAVLQCLVPRDWLWVVWLLQVTNVSGAAGDIYVTVKLVREPQSILVRDTGIAMTVFDRA